MSRLKIMHCQMQFIFLVQSFWQPRRCQHSNISMSLTLLGCKATITIMSQNSIVVDVNNIIIDIIVIVYCNCAKIQLLQNSLFVCGISS